MTTNRKTDERQFGNYCALLKHTSVTDQKKKNSRTSLTISALYVFFFIRLLILRLKNEKNKNGALSKQARESMLYKIVTSFVISCVYMRTQILSIIALRVRFNMFIAASFLSHQNRLVLKCIDFVE